MRGWKGPCNVRLLLQVISTIRRVHLLARSRFGTIANDGARHRVGSGTPWVKVVQDRKRFGDVGEDTSFMRFSYVTNLR